MSTEGRGSMSVTYIELDSPEAVARAMDRGLEIDIASYDEGAPWWRRLNQSEFICLDTWFKAGCLARARVARGQQR